MDKQKIEDASKEYSKGKSSSEFFREQHEKDLIAGAEWALSQPKETKGVEELRAEIANYGYVCTHAESSKEKSELLDDVWNKLLPHLQTQSKDSGAAESTKNIFVSKPDEWKDAVQKELNQLDYDITKEE